jgi:hypothetical protein
MICRNCRDAGDYNQQGLTGTAEVYHGKCTGKEQCACQHGVGAQWVNRDGNSRS